MFRLIGIPVRTLDDWENERRTPPEWTERLVINEIKRLNKIKMEEKEMKNNEMVKYLVHNEALTVTDVTVFDTLEEANKEAEMLWDHLTYSEKKDKDNRVYVLDVRSSDLLEDAIDEDGNIDWAANSGGGYVDGRFDSDDLEV
ncbi:MAG: hypothetical protein RSN61_21495 [Chryseobacterium sp.]|uniref:hypothetical protein n=1 Tax=Chryseobacterium sp. TaxID=1871047 RepID=UPI002FCAB732